MRADLAVLEAKIASQDSEEDLNKLLGTLENDLLVGTLSSDIISDLGGNDSVAGNLGNDIISGGGGKDVLEAIGTVVMLKSALAVTMLFLVVQETTKLVEKAAMTNSLVMKEMTRFGATMVTIF